MKDLHLLCVFLLGFFSTAGASPYTAARNGDLQALRHYRFEGIDLYIPDERGFIPYELAALHADPDKDDTLRRHVEVMLWLKEYQPEKHRYGKAANALVQAGLNALGYNAGKPDGIFGEHTSDAIVAYQRDNELAETGRLGPQWLGMFYQDSLKDLQFKLTKLGFNTRGTDGMMGPNTQNAMLTFRQKNRLSAPDYLYLDGLLLSTVDHQFNEQERRHKAAIAEKARQATLHQTRYVQAGLRALGYRIGKIDGKSGSKTVNAIKAFQQKNKRPVTGELDTSTLQTMHNAFVKDSQRKLNTLGYKVGKPDGKMGKRSINALRQYRKRHGLSANAKIDADLLSSLQRKYLVSENQRKASETKTRQQKNEYHVRFAQAGLRTLGHPVSIDGIIGKTTVKRIRAFQKRYQLKQTGKIDSPTYAKMRMIFLKETQRKLNTLGYKTGKPDGKMGKRTQVAIKTFRRKAKVAGEGFTADLIAAVDDTYDNRTRKHTSKANNVGLSSSQVKQQTKTTRTRTPKNKTVATVTTTIRKPTKTVKPHVTKTTSRHNGRSAKGRMSFNRSGGRVKGCSIAGRNIPIEWCEPFYPLPKNNHCEATFKPSSGAVINLWCK